MPTTMTRAATGPSSAGNSLSSNVDSVFAASFLSTGKMNRVTIRRASRAINSSSALTT